MSSTEERIRRHSPWGPFEGLWTPCPKASAPQLQLYGAVRTMLPLFSLICLHSVATELSEWLTRGGVIGEGFPFGRGQNDHLLGRYLYRINGFLSV